MGAAGGRGSAEMTGAALMHGNSPLTSRGTVELDWALHTDSQNDAGAVDDDCMGAVSRVDSRVRSFTCAIVKCHLVPVTNRFIDLDFSSLRKHTQLFCFLLSFACETRRFALQEGLWSENTEQLEVVSRSQAPRLSLSGE